MRWRTLGFLMLFWGAWSGRAETLQVVADPWPPYIDKAHPRQGVAIEIVTTALARAGYDSSLTVDTWPRALEGVSIGVFDVVAAIWHTPERDATLVFSEPYLFNEVKFLKKKGQDFDFEDLGDLRGVVIGVVKGYAYEEAFVASPQLIRITHNHVLQTLSSLVQGEVDLVVGDGRALRYHIDHYFKGSDGELEFLKKPLSRRGLRIGVSRTHPQQRVILTRFNRALSAMRADGTYQELLKAYGE